MKIGFSLFLLFFGIAVRAQELEGKLVADRARDDLSNWVYDQIQWVAKAPADRSSVLVQAVGQAWRRPRTNEEVQAWQDLLTNEGYALLQAGSIVPSTDAYTAAYEWARQHRDIADGSLVLESILKPLGNNYTRLGDYEQALFIHRKALAFAIALGDKQVLAGVYSNLANTCSNMGRIPESLDYCRLGLVAADPRSALYGLLLSEQADAYLQVNDLSAAKASIGQSIAVLSQAGGSASYWLFMAYQQAGDIYNMQPTLALGFYNKALTLQGRGRQREKAKLFFRLASLYSQMGRSEEALSWMDTCLSVLVPGKTFAALRASDLYAENTLADLLFVRAELLRGLNADEALRFYGLSFAATGRLRQELISGSSREQVVADTRSRYDKAIGFAWNAWEMGRDKKTLAVLLGFMESSKSQLLLEELLRNRVEMPGDSLTARTRLLEKALSYYEKEVVQGSSSDSTVLNSLKQIRWELAQLRKKRGLVGLAIEEGSDKVPGGDVVRSFFCGASAIYTVECSLAGISFAEKLPLSASWQDSLRSFIHHWFGQGANAMIGHPLTYYREAYGIYHDLFGQHPLKEGVSYILLPDGALNLLPVDALVISPVSSPSPADWPFVIRTLMVSYGWSLKTLNEQDHHSAGKGISGFFVSGNVRATPTLKAVEDEKKGIQKLFRGGSWYMDSAATTDRFRQSLESSAVVHISSHAFSSAQDSGFVGVPRIELFDAPFYLFELRVLKSQPELVVLGACRTGDGRTVTGEGVQSLARAFTGGGANAVVAGWWNVDDETAARLMEAFYSQMKDNADKKENAARALRAAKLSWLKDPNVPYLKKLPYYWAALNYQGNPQPLDGKLFAFRDYRYWWSILLLIIILVLYRVRRSGKLR